MTVLDCPEEGPSRNPQRAKRYRELCGVLRWIEQCTRPDISTTLSELCKVQINPGEAHVKALHHLMKYVNATKGRCIVYGREETMHASGRIVGYVDSDWANCKVTRRSHTGWLVRLNGDLICFGSKLQSAVARSSAEAEYMALSMIIRMLLWLINIIEGIPGQFIRRPIPVYEDNKPCIKQPRRQPRRSQVHQTHWNRAPLPS